MKIKADGNRCMGSGVCEAICPQVFSVEAGRVQVSDENVPDELLSAVEDAVESCPSEALSLEEG